MEGYYDGIIFHRVVPGFLVQTGDKTGTGGGGESIYGEPFEDEIHPRLRFAHRGLVAMANNGSKDSNDSQFIITLDRADELHGKHTLFGRCMGDTVYNVIKIGEMEIDANERPVYPPKIKGIRIIDNPFDDIVPRITAEEKRIQQRAREEAQKEREEEQRRKGAKKNVKLLSFADDDDAVDEEEPVVFKKKAIVRPDLIDNPEQRSALPEMLAATPKVPQMIPEPPAKPQKESKKLSTPKDTVDITKIREQHRQEQESGSNSRKAEIEKIEADIRKISRRRNGGADSDDEPSKKKVKKSYLEEELAKYSKGKGSKKGKRKDEGDVLAALNSFRGKLQSSMPDGPDDAEMDDGGGEEGEKVPQAGEEDPGIEVDDDRGFLTHALHFPKDDGEETRKADREYEVIDPRERGAKAKEEERERKRLAKAKAGGGRQRR
ncbi:hypothetical protein HWV62_19537 [Athelia sp. TMB]|nr:hypothetical protein HWV62_19537 [Athelia sp. TMB]